MLEMSHERLESCQMMLEECQGELKAAQQRAEVAEEELREPIDYRSLLERFPSVFRSSNV